MTSLTPSEKKLISISTYYQIYQKANGWQATAVLLRDKIHKNLKGDKKSN